MVNQGALTWEWRRSVTTITWTESEPWPSCARSGRLCSSYQGGHKMHHYQCQYYPAEGTDHYSVSVLPNRSYLVSVLPSRRYRSLSSALPSRRYRSLFSVSITQQKVQITIQCQYYPTEGTDHYSVSVLPSRRYRSLFSVSITQQKVQITIQCQYYPAEGTDHYSVSVLPSRRYRSLFSVSITQQKVQITIQCQYYPADRYKSLFRVSITQQKVQITIQCQYYPVDRYRSLFRVSITQQKVEIAGDVIPFASRILPCIVSKLTTTLVLAELVNGLQDQSNHSLHTSVHSSEQCQKIRATFPALIGTEFWTMPKDQSNIACTHRYTVLNIATGSEQSFPTHIDTNKCTMPQNQGYHSLHTPVPNNATGSKQSFSAQITKNTVQYQSISEIISTNNSQRILCNALVFLKSPVQFLMYTDQSLC